MIDFENFEQYRSHFVYPPDDVNLYPENIGKIIIKLTDDSPYSNIIVEYYDMSLKGDSLSFKYNLNDSTIDIESAYLGDILITIIIDSLNNSEKESHENRNINFIEPNQ